MLEVKFTFFITKRDKENDEGKVMDIERDREREREREARRANGHKNLAIDLLKDQI